MNGNRALLFPSTYSFFDCLNGPPNHSAHVKTWRQHVILQRKLAWADEADKRVNAATDEIIARIRAERVAASNRKFTDSLARMHNAFVASKHAAE